jgi:hypothetical protein
MATLFDLPRDHPLVVEAVQDARALVTARMGLMAGGELDMQIYEVMLTDMVERSFGGTPPDPYPMLYAVQLAALANLATKAIAVTAGAKDQDSDSIRAGLFVLLDQRGENL